MDTQFAGIVLILGLLGPVAAENKYGDHGMVFTARPYKDREDYRQLIAIPTTPREVDTYPGRPQTFPGIQFDDIKMKLIACDVDYDMNRLYIYDYNYRSLILGTNFNTSMNEGQINFTTEHNGISQEYVKIAVDWISHNIYWTDPVMGAIVMTSGEPGTNHTMYKVLFNKHLDLPRGIAVDPLAGYLFWTDYSDKQSKIERSSLTGQGRTLLVGTNLIYPEAVTADHISQTLFFVNSKAVESIDYNGKGRKQIFSQSNAYFFDIAYHGGVVIALDIESPRYAYFYDVKTGEQIEKITSSEEAYFGVCMYHKDNQPSKAEYRCPNAGCDDLCVDEPGKATATCLCRTGYELDNDGKSCKMLAGQYQRAIVLNNGTHLCLLDIRILSDHHDHKIDCFYEHTVTGETMTYMEVNGRAREVYIATQKAIYKVAIDQKNAVADKLTATLPNNKGNGEITGMSWDYMSGHLYWSEMNPDAIFVMNPDSPATEFVQLASKNENLTMPRAILVLPHDRQLLWLNGNASDNDVIIMKTDLGASAPVQAIKPTEMPTDVFILEPSHMLNHVKDRKLYILDAGWSEILVFTYDGEYLTDYDTDDAKDFAIYNDYILVAHHDSDNKTSMFSADLGFGPPFTVVADGVVEGIGQVVSMRILDVDVLEPPYTDPCRDLNGKAGGCDQICIAISKETTCLCDIGFKLNADGKKCDSAYPTLTDRFALVVDTTHSKIHQLSMDQAGVLNGIGTAGQTSITSVLYHYLNNKVILSSYNSDQIWQVDLDGTNETMLTEVSWGTPKRMALDPSTGNIYLTAESHWSWWLDNWSFLAMVSPSGAYKVLLEGDSDNSDLTINIPGDIVLHAGKGYMFWADAATDQYAGKIVRASMDGSNAVIIATGTGIEVPTTLAIDYQENMLYWGDEFLKNIYKSDFDGNNRETFLEVGSVVGDIRMVGNYLYYTTDDYIKIRWVHKSNSSDVGEFGPDTGVGVLNALDIYVAAEVSKIPKHALCSNDNGGCSDFCLPNEAGGRTCACEEYTELLVDEKTCESHGCPSYTGNAYIAKDCLRLPGYQCEFECFTDLKPKTDIYKLTCLANKTWDVDMPCRDRHHQNKYGDEGVVLTARGFSLNDFNQVVVIPTKPEGISTYPARSFPGFRFSDVKKKLHAVDVDYSMNMIYMYDYEYRTIVVGSNFSADANIDAVNFTTEHYGVAKEYVKIAVDWVSHNIYWTDTLMGAIIMAPGQQYISPTLYKVIIQDHLDLPRGIAVDPLEGYIFWTDVGKHSKIERASLLGENRRDLISNGLYIPDAIAADHTMRRIYFTNYNYIDSVNYDGQKRMSITKNSQAYFFDISVFNNVIMATETSNYYLFLYDATTGQKISQEGSAQEGYFGICGYSIDAQPTTPDELCFSAGCQDICVEEPNSVKATCLCRTGSELQTDGKTCKEIAGQYQRSIILNNGTHLCLLDVRVMSDHHNHKVNCFYQHTETNDTITYIDVNMKSREVYFTAGKSLYRVRIESGSNDITATQLTMIPDNKDSKFTGLSYDWINDHLYWSQTGPDGIFLINPDSPEDFLQIASGNSTYNPRGVIVVPHNKTLFWIATNKTSGNTSFIEYGDLGLTRPLQTIVQSEEDDETLREPTHLVHDNKNDRMYILDVGWKSILEVKYNGTLTNYFEVGDAKDFALYNDYILVIEHDKNGNTRMYSGDIGYFPYSLTADGLVQDIGTVISMKVIDVDVLQKTYPSPCGEKEGKFGGCEQICMPVDNKPSCRCDTGFTLNSDNTTCDSSPVKDNFIVVVDNLHSKIYQMPLDNDTIMHGIKVPNKDNPTGIIYNYLTNQLVFGSWESSQIWGVNIDGTNATFIADIDEWSGTPTNFALDPSTGNLYITAYSYYVDYGLKDSFIAAVNPTGGVAILYNMGEYLADIVLHAQKGLMFWTDYGEPAMVARAAMDGTGMIRIADGSDVVYPTGLAIDYKAGHLYWQDALLHKIFKSDLDGNNKVVFHEDESYLNDIRLFGDYLYYTGLDNLHLTRLHKDDATDAKRIGPRSGIGAFATVDIYRSSMVSTIPVNEVCSKANGNCSHFCLPNGAGGRTCGCEGTYDLLSDGTTCENVPRCTAGIMGGTVDETCHRLVGQQCGFTCNHGYKKKEGVLKLLCQEAVDPEMAESQPKWDDEAACEEIFCPATIPNGQLPDNCTPKVDKSCLDYTCSQGFEKNTAVTSLNCTIDGVWDTDITTLCKEKCPKLTMERDMAELNPGCNRDPQDNCGYTCKKHWKPATNRTTIMCSSPSQWNVNTATLCEEIKCPDYVPNGIVHSNCSYTVDSVCTFDCNERHDRNGDVSKITCKPSGDWDKLEDKIPLCIAIPVAPEAQTDSLAIGLGVGLAVLVILIILIFVCILLQRKGKLHLPSRKSGGSGSAFENPQYLESSFDDAPPGASREANKDFTYATLKEDKLELTEELARRAPENVYDNSAPATLPASAINPKF